MGCAFSKSITSSHEEESSVTHTEEDFWIEIFLRLPLDSIFRSKSVSKVWLSTISNPNFINKWYEINNSSLPWVLLHFTDSVEDDSPNDNNNKLRRKFTITHPDSHSQFVSQHQNGFSFTFLIPNLPNRSNDDDQGWKGIVLIGSSNGLVLCHTKLHNQKYFFVCNPLTQTWISLPPPPTQNSWLVTGFVCNNQCFSLSLVSTIYKVIHIPKFEAAVKDFNVEVFCSDLGQWNIFRVLSAQYVIWEFSVHDNFVTHNGVLYWFQKMKRIILAVCVNGNTNHGTSGNDCRLINLPDRAMDSDIKLRHRLGESEGLVCYAIVKEMERSLSVWVLEEDWCFLYKDNKFGDMLAEMESMLTGEIGRIDLITGIQVLGFNPMDKNVVILGYGKYIWAYNTKTKGHEQLSRPYFLRTNCSVSQLSLLTFAPKARPPVLPPVSW